MPDTIYWNTVAEKTVSLECGARHEVGDDTYVVAWISPDEPEEQALILQHCWSDSRIITQDNGYIGSTEEVAEQVWEFVREAERGLFS